jgi:phosphoribosylformylglycinamidine synthase
VPEFVLFGEDASRVLISCDPQNVQRIQQVALQYGLLVEPIGETGPDQLEIQIDGKAAVSASVFELRNAWDSALERALHVETEERLVPSTLQKS